MRADDVEETVWSRAWQVFYNRHIILGQPSETADKVSLNSLYTEARDLKTLCGIMKGAAVMRLKLWN